MLEGAVRSGKSVLNVALYALNLETSKDMYHLATGTTIGNAKNILGECNGYGLKHIYGANAKWTFYRDKPALEIKTFTTQETKIIIFAGGQTVKDENNIVGLSFGSWIATEIDRHHINFVKEALRRLAISDNMKVYWDLNPTQPNHFIYKDYIDHYLKNTPERINFKTLTIFDNKAFRQDQLDNFLANYEKDSIWYRRDVLGERINLAGGIYPNFSTLTHTNTLTNVTKPYVRYFIGMDWGYSKTGATAFVLVGEHADGNVQIIDEYYDEDSLRSSQDNLQKALEFIDKWKHYYPVVYPDSADIGMLRDLQRHYSFTANTKKPRILDRIRLMDKLILLKKIRINKDCVHTIDSILNAVYDQTQSNNIRLDNGTYNLDSLDALEYALTDIFWRMEKNEYNLLVEDNLVEDKYAYLNTN